MGLYTFRPVPVLGAASIYANGSRAGVFVPASLLRTALEDVCGTDIPAGTTLVLPPWAVHRDPKWWDDPETFRPERFDDDYPEYAYFLFGGRPGYCIGMRFVRMQMKTVLATILDEYSFELVSDPGPDLIASTNLKPAEPIEIELQEMLKEFNISSTI